MNDSVVLDSVAQLKTLLTSPRIDLMTRMASPSTCPGLGRQLSMTPQKVYYHVKALERVGLVRKVREEQVRGIMQGVYQASARSVALAPSLVRRIGGRKAATSSVSLGQLADMADKIARDIDALATEPEPAILTLDTDITIPPGARSEFLRAAQRAVEDLAREYGDTIEGEPFRLLLGCYQMPGSGKEE